MNSLNSLRLDSKPADGGSVVAAQLVAPQKVVTGTPGDVTAPSGVKPNKVTDVNQAAPAEALKGEFDVDDSILGSFGEVEQLPVQASAPVVKKDEVKVEPKVTEAAKTLAAAKVKAEPVKISAETISTGTRDYTGYTPEEVSVLKAMSKPAFEYTTKLIKENKELGSLKESQYLQHPDAYSLSPEYKQLNREVYLVQQEQKFWEEQLLNIRAGKEWFDLQGFDPNTLQPVLGNKNKPTDKDDIDVSNRMQRVGQIGYQKQGQLQQFQSTFTNRVTHDQNNIQQELAKRFDWVANPKLADNPVDIPGLGPTPIKKIESDFVSLFPSYIANSPGMMVAKNMFTALQIAAARIRELESNVQTEQVKVQEVLRGEPNGDAQQDASVKNGKVTEFSTAGMPD